MSVPERIEQKKIVPVVAMRRAGKSKLLNTLFNFNYLQCESGIATKFVNILRYNPNIDSPRFYHLELKKMKMKNIYFLRIQNIIQFIWTYNLVFFISIINIINWNFFEIYFFIYR